MFIQDEKYYLRSLGVNPRKDVADVHKDFPQLAPDLRIPDLYPEDRFFSSVFRIASRGVQLWTHYDVGKYTFFDFPKSIDFLPKILDG